MVLFKEIITSRPTTQKKPQSKPEKPTQTKNKTPQNQTKKPKTKTKRAALFGLNDNSKDSFSLTSTE